MLADNIISNYPQNKNKAKAATVFIDMEKARVLQGTSIKDQPFPVVGLRVRL